MGSLLLLRLGLLICKNKITKITPLFQDYLEGGVRSWMRRTLSRVGPRNKLAPFSCDPVCWDDLISVSHVGGSLWENDK